MPGGPQKSYAPKSDKTHVSTATEYVLVYAKNEDRAKTGALPRTSVADARYKNADGDRRVWKGGDAMGPGAKTHQGMVYGIQSPFTGEIFYPTSGNCWRSDKRYMKEWLEQWGAKYVERDLNDGEQRSAAIGLPPTEIKEVKALVISGSTEAAAKKAGKVLDNGPWPRLFFGQKGTGRPQLKNYLEDVKQGFVPMTYWANDDYDIPLGLDAVSWAHQQSGHSQTGIDELDAIVGKGHGFETVKPLKLFEKIIQIWCPPDGLVMDPFAGSGTTGHAVLDLNEASDSTRRFIVMEQGRPDRGDPYARSLLADRLRRVATGDWASGEHAPLPGGYRFCQLQKTVDARALLEMERDEMTDAVIASHYDINKRGGPSLVLMTTEGYEYLVARNASGEGFYLVWDGSPTPPVFDADVYDRVVNEAKKAELKSTYHVYARFNLFQSDDITFYQIPDQILLDFGLNANDPFNNEDSDHG
jgi:adenine-specific DNA-methyltransferase